MSKYIRLLLMGWVVISLACNNGNDATNSTAITDSGNLTTIQWVDSVINFGKINYGETIQLKFQFRNTGNKPLLISHVRAGCGCTVADYTREAVAPEGTGAVTASFDSKRAQPGTVRKNLVVYTNTKDGNVHTLIFTGEVLAAKAD